MERDAELDHLVGGDAFALVFRVRKASVRQVETAVQLFGSERRVRRIDDDVAPSCSLQKSLSVHFVALFLDVSEVLGVKLGLLQAILVAVEHDVVLLDASGYLFLLADEGNLVGHLGHHLAHHLSCDTRLSILVVVKFRMEAIDCLVEPLNELQRGLFSHSICDEVGIAILKDAGAETLLPIVVVHHSAQACLDASEHDGHIGKELPEDVGIDDGGVLWTQVVPPVGTVCILAPEAAGSGVFVHHAVHASGRDAEEETGTSQLLEVAKIPVPVGLGHDSYAQALCLEQTPYDSGSEGRMVHIGICAEENHISLFPPTQVHLFPGRRQPIVVIKMC